MLTKGFRLAPGCCHACRTTDQSLWVLDTRREDPGVLKRHQVYLCERCIIAAATEMAEYAGIVVIGREAWDADRVALTEALAWQKRAEKAESTMAALLELAADLNVGVPA